MRKRYGETEKQTADRFISEYRAAADVFPALCAVIRAFDGKMYNKRFDDAITEKCGRSVFVQKKQGPYNSSVVWVYVYTNSNEQITILWMQLPENKRISAADFIENAKAYREKCLQEAAHMEQILPTVDTRRKQLDYIKSLLENTLADLSYTEKDIFNLNYHVKAW